MTDIIWWRLAVVLVLAAAAIAAVAWVLWNFSETVRMWWRMGWRK